MDQQRDFFRFRQLIARLCETLGKPITDELVESWWKALRHVDLETVGEHVDRFLAKADDTTKFPRPGQMRPKDMVPREDLAGRNPPRDYWRSVIVEETRRGLGLTHELMEETVSQYRELSGMMLTLLDEMHGQELRDGRTHGMHIGCFRRCQEIARSWHIEAVA